MTKLPEMMPPRIIDALVAQGRREMFRMVPMEPLVFNPPVPTESLRQLHVTHLPMIVFTGEPAELGPDEIDRLRSQL